MLFVIVNKAGEFYNGAYGWVKPHTTGNIIVFPSAIDAQNFALDLPKGNYEIKQLIFS